MNLEKECLRGQNEQVGLVMGYASPDPVRIVKGVTLLDKAIAKPDL